MPPAAGPTTSDWDVRVLWCGRCQRPVHLLEAAGMFVLPARDRVLALHAECLALARGMR
jgi:hypothetical protein